MNTKQTGADIDAIRAADDRSFAARWARLAAAAQSAFELAGYRAERDRLATYADEDEPLSSSNTERKS